MHKPKSLIEIFNYLSPLVPAMDKFKKDKDGALRADQIHLIKEVYPDIQVFCNGCLSRVFNVNCSSCVREVFEILISFYDRLARDPNINNKAEDVSLMAYMAAEAAKINQGDGSDDEDLLAKQDASKALMSEQEEDTLLHLLGITKDNTPDEYLSALWVFVNHEDNLAQIPEDFHLKLAKKLEDLLMSDHVTPETRLSIMTQYAATLPEGDKTKAALDEGMKTVLIPVEAKSEPVVENETKDEVINEDRDGKPLAEEANIPLNTVDTRTKWQKTADTKKANAAKKAAEEAKKTK